MIKAIVILGKSAVNRFDETGKVPSKSWLKQNDGVVDTKEFRTKAEYIAYSEGMNDADGWEATMIFEPVGEQNDCSCCEGWRNQFINNINNVFCPACGKQLKEKIELDYIVFEGKQYPIRKLNIPEYEFNDHYIAIQTLEDMLLGENREYISAEAENVDQGIVFYVSENVFYLSDKELADFVLENIG